MRREASRGGYPRRVRAVIEEVFPGFHWRIHTENGRQIAVTGNVEDLRAVIRREQLVPWREMQESRGERTRVQLDQSGEWLIS